MDPKQEFQNAKDFQIRAEGLGVLGFGAEGLGAWSLGFRALGFRVRRDVRPVSFKVGLVRTLDNTYFERIV